MVSMPAAIGLAERDTAMTRFERPARSMARLARMARLGPILPEAPRIRRSPSRLRTGLASMTKLKVPRLHVEKVLNHSTGDVAEVYDRHDYLPEKRAALEKWAEHLTEIIAGKTSKVVDFPQTAQA